MGSPLTIRGTQEPLFSPSLNELRKADSFQESERNIIIAKGLTKRTVGLRQISKSHWRGLSGSDWGSPGTVLVTPGALEASLAVAAADLRVQHGPRMVGCR